MVPTIPWMKQKFAEYNKEYFNGTLPTPKFEVCALDNLWGNYQMRAGFDEYTRKIVNVKDNGTIQLTSKYSREEAAVESTLMHEMCHEYVQLVNPRTYPKDIHGAEFKAAANKFGEYAQAILAEMPLTDKDKLGGQNKSNGCLLCYAYFPEREDFKWWVCKAERSNVNEFVQKLKSLGGKVFVLKSPSDKLFHFHSDTQTLTGWQGENKHEVAEKIAEYCGDDASNFHIDVLQKMQQRQGGNGNNQQKQYGGNNKPQN